MNLSQDQKTIISKIVEFLCYGLTTLITLTALILDIVWLKNNINEDSMTEIIQESTLVIIIALFVKLAFQYKDQRNAHILIAGFFACMFVRELDAFFDDYIGSWSYLAFSIAFVTVIATFRRPQLTIKQLAEYTRQPQYAYMIIGLIAVLIFSRLFGMQIIWRSLMEDQYLRTVKNVAEEGLELFGYSLCLISTLLYHRYFSRSQRKLN